MTATDARTPPPSSAPETFRRSFAGTGQAVGEVREFLAGHLAGSSWPVGDVTVAASELATNAILHSRSGYPGGVLDVRLRVKPFMVQVEICDQGALPAEARPAPDARCEGGLGLPIVAALTSEHGGYTDPRTGFHIAWFRILPPPERDADE